MRGADPTNEKAMAAAVLEALSWQAQREIRALLWAWASAKTKGAG